jgi:hypothetical protein
MAVSRSARTGVNSRQMVPSLGQGVEASDDSFEVAPGRARKEFDTVILAGNYVDDDEGRRLLLRSRHESDRTLGHRRSRRRRHATAPKAAFWTCRLHRGLHTHRTLETVQVEPRRKPRFAGLLQAL